MLCGNCHNWHRRIDNVSDNYPNGRCFSEKAVKYLNREDIPPDKFGCIHFEPLSDTRLKWKLSKEENKKIISDVISALSSECVIPIDDAEFIVYRISCGKIPHVSINF